jgi:hypothetical protein
MKLDFNKLFKKVEEASKLPKISTIEPEASKAAGLLESIPVVEPKAVSAFQLPLTPSPKSSKPSPKPVFSLAAILSEAKKQQEAKSPKVEEKDSVRVAKAEGQEESAKVLSNSNEVLYEELKEILVTETPFSIEHLLEDESLLEAKPSTFKPVDLTPEQLQGVELARQGKSFNLIGPAGSGKSTAQMAVASELLRTGKLGTHDFKVQGGGGLRWTGPSIAFCAFTRLAAQNLKKIIFCDPLLAESLLHNVTTIHNLLEFEPEEVQVQDEETGQWTTRQRFMPQRTSARPLSLTHLVIEESSQVSLELAQLLADALPASCQIIFIGDLNQLPPPMGAPLLAWSSLMLPVIELKKVHRQTGESLVLKNAHLVLAGKLPVFDDKEFQLVNMGGPARLVSQDHWLSFIRQQLDGWLDSGLYNPMTDIFLSPYGDIKHSMGSLNICKILAGAIGRRRDAKVFHVKAGYEDHYLAEGDDILYEKMQGKIIKITPNALYTGRKPLTPSKYLSRFGIYNWPEKLDGKVEQEKLLVEMMNGGKADGTRLDLDAIQAMIDGGTLSIQKEELTQASSHVVHLEVYNPVVGSTQIVQMKTSGAFSPTNFQLAYALTVYKAQGQEWRNTFVICHPDHSSGNCRESFYTAITRSKERSVVLGFLPTVLKTIKSQKLKGDTLKQKLRFYEERTKGDLPPQLLRTVLEHERVYADE